MMDISINDLIDRHNESIARLDPNKNCGTCKYESTGEDLLPCRECFNFMLFIHVNPTKWEALLAKD